MEGARLQPRPDIPEIALAFAWHEGQAGHRFQTVDGRSVEVVHRGIWTHGFGPDFRDAMLVFDGRHFITGAIEIHLTTSGWSEHGHHLDERYNSVVLHLVHRHDGRETRRADGALVPVAELELDPALLTSVNHRALTWAAVGGDVCAETMTREQPAAIREALWRLGDLRLAVKAARLEARLTALPPAEVLYQELWDGLGFSANRTPMRDVAQRLPLAAIEAALSTCREPERQSLTRGLLFGVAGLMPLSPADAAMARLAPRDVGEAERMWRERGTPWHGECLSPAAWTRARVRPANHPALRLAAGAALLANAQGGLLTSLLASLRSGCDPSGTLQELATWNGHAGIGADRAAGLTVNAILPFALALASQSGDTALADAVATVWEHLPPAEPNEVTRRALRQVAGRARLPGLGARGQQGLIHLDTALCGPRRCYECPIAHLVAGQMDPDDALRNN